MSRLPETWPTDSAVSRATLHAVITNVVAGWDEEWQAAWNERAAIIEVDERQSREEAEMLAFWRMNKEAASHDQQ